MDIKEIRLILPAFVSFTNNGQEYTTFVYLDQLKNDVIIPDNTDLPNDFKEKLIAFYKSKSTPFKIPEVPKFEKDF